MSSGREGRLTKSAARVWAVGVGRFNNNYKPGGRRSSSATEYQIPPWRARYALSTGTQQGGDWTRTTPAISSEPSRLAGGLGIASQAMTVLLLARPMCLRCHDTACLSTACSARYRAWLRIADVRPLTAGPRCDHRRPTVPKSSSGFSSARATRDLRDRVCPGLCDLVLL